MLRAAAAYGSRMAARFSCTGRGRDGKKDADFQNGRIENDLLAAVAVRNVGFDLLLIPTSLGRGR